MRLELTRVGLLVDIANHYTTKGAQVIHLVGSARVFHISLQPQKNTTERIGEGEQINNMDLGQLQAQERGFCVTIICSFSCICRLARNFYKATRNANSFLTVFPHCLLLRTVRSLDCYLTPTGLFCCPLSIASPLLSSLTRPSLLSDLPFFLHFRSRRRS